MQTPHDPVSLPRLPGSQGARAAETMALHSAALSVLTWIILGPRMAPGDPPSSSRKVKS